jgi:hypothetical protein
MQKPEFSKLDPDAMYPILLKFGLQTSGDHAAFAERLVDFFDGRQDLSGPCDNCGAVSPLELDVCPFCGMGDATPSVLAGSAPPPAPHKKTPNREKDPPMTTSITKAQPETLQSASTKLLDQAVADIKRIQKELGANSWALAVKLTQVNESELWKTRRTETDQVAYKTFEQFTRAEVGFGRKQAQDLMRICANFTEQEVSDYGSAKLRLVLQAAPEIKQRLLGKIKQGATAREVAEEARANPAKSPTQKRNKKAAKSRVDNKPTSAITVASIEGKKNIRAYVRPTGKKGDLNDQKPAMTIDDAPWGYMDLANDVRMFILLLRAPTGELMFQVTFKRNEK